MPNRITKGENYTAVRVKSGTSARGDWELIAVKDEKGHNEVALFVNNRPSGVVDGGSFKVTEIFSIARGKKKNSREEWEENVSAEVNVEAIEPEYTQLEDNNGFTELPNVDLPFDAPEIPDLEVGELPF